MSEALVMVRNALNTLPNPVIVLGKDGAVVDANLVACEMHGVDQLGDFTFPEEVTESMAKALLGENCTIECKVTNKKTGKDVWLKVTANPVYTNVSSQPTGVSLFEKDVTSRRAFVEELKTMKRGKSCQTKF